MRVALFTGNYNYLREGANQALNRLVAYLEERRGYEVRVYSPVTSTPAFEPAGTLVPVPSIPLPIRSEFRLALGLPRAIRRDVARFAPALVHVATPDILDTRAQSFAKRLGVPVVASLHTRFEAYLEYYGLAWVRPLLEAHLHRFYRRSDYVLVPNAAIEAEMLRIRGDSHVSIWSRGVDRVLFDPARRDLQWRRSQGLADDETVILFFGRLVLEKGVSTFVSVVRGLQQRGVKVRPLIVGAGPAATVFEALAGVVLTGHLMGDDLAKAVASADILLNPSTTETFGNVVLESMASGLAVVGADVPSTRALVDHDCTGILCSSGDLEGYAAAIESLVGRPETRRAMGAAGCKASNAYSWDAASAAVQQVYERVADAQARPA